MNLLYVICKISEIKTYLILIQVFYLVSMNIYENTIPLRIIYRVFHNEYYKSFLLLLQLGGII